MPAGEELSHQGGQQAGPKQPPVRGRGGAPGDEEGPHAMTSRKHTAAHSPATSVGKCANTAQLSTQPAPCEGTGRWGPTHDNPGTR